MCAVRRTKKVSDRPAGPPRSGSEELLPLGQCRGSVQLEILPAVEVAFLVEVVVDR